MRGEISARFQQLRTNAATPLSQLVGNDRERLGHLASGRREKWYPGGRLSDESDFGDLMARFGIRRSDPGFWGLMSTA